MNVVCLRIAIAGALVAAAVVFLAVFAEITLAFGRPPQALPLGTIQWFYEVGATVDRVERTAQIGRGAQAIHADGEFYIVHARIIAPYGLRPAWSDREVEVRTFAGRGGTMHDVRFSVDERAQTLLDRETGRPGPEHLVRGAEQREVLVFDLPRNVEQPALLFLPANDPWGLLSIVVGEFWQPHRFNIRYD
jgi:hypothetical protein